MPRFVFALVTASFASVGFAADEPVTPKERTALFNGKDLTGLTTWLKDSKRDDPKKVFRVTDGVLHLTGDGFGYVATEKAYKDYRVVIEYKWGKKTDGGKYVRNSGLLLHATGPDGGAGGTWMSCVECQLAQGCCGDLIVIRGKDEKDKPIPVQITSDIALGPDKHRAGKKAARKRCSPVVSCGGTSTTRTSRSCSTLAARTTWRANSGSGRRWSACVTARR